MSIRSVPRYQFDSLLKCLGRDAIPHMVRSDHPVWQFHPGLETNTDAKGWNALFKGAPPEVIMATEWDHPLALGMNALPDTLSEALCTRLVDKFFESRDMTNEDAKGRDFTCRTAMKYLDAIYGEHDELVSGARAIYALISLDYGASCAQEVRTASEFAAMCLEYTDCATVGDLTEAAQACMRGSGSLAFTHEALGQHSGINFLQNMMRYADRDDGMYQAPCAKASRKITTRNLVRCREIPEEMCRVEEVQVALDAIALGIGSYSELEDLVIESDKLFAQGRYDDMHVFDDCLNAARQTLADSIKKAGDLYASSFCRKYTAVAVRDCVIVRAGSTRILLTYEDMREAQNLLMEYVGYVLSVAIESTEATAKALSTAIRQMWASASEGGDACASYLSCAGYYIEAQAKLASIGSVNRDGSPVCKSVYDLDVPSNVHPSAGRVFLKACSKATKCSDMVSAFTHIRGLRPTATHRFSPQRILSETYHCYNYKSSTNQEDLEEFSREYLLVMCELHKSVTGEFPEGMVTHLKLTDRYALYLDGRQIEAEWLDGWDYTGSGTWDDNAARVKDKTNVYNDVEGAKNASLFRRHSTDPNVSREKLYYDRLGGPESWKKEYGLFKGKMSTTGSYPYLTATVPKAEAKPHSRVVSMEASMVRKAFQVYSNNLFPYADNVPFSLMRAGKRKKKSIHDKTANVLGDSGGLSGGVAITDFTKFGHSIAHEIQVARAEIDAKWFDQPWIINAVKNLKNSVIVSQSQGFHIWFKNEVGSDGQGLRNPQWVVMLYASMRINLRRLKAKVPALEESPPVSLNYYMDDHVFPFRFVLKSRSAEARRKETIENLFTCNDELSSLYTRMGWPMEARKGAISVSGFAITGACFSASGQRRTPGKGTGQILTDPEHRAPGAEDFMGSLTSTARSALDDKGRASHAFVLDLLATGIRFAKQGLMKLKQNMCAIVVATFAESSMNGFAKPLMHHFSIPLGLSANNDRKFLLFHHSNNKAKFSSAARALLMQKKCVSPSVVSGADPRFSTFVRGVDTKSPLELTVLRCLPDSTQQEHARYSSHRADSLQKMMSEDCSMPYTRPLAFHQSHPAAAYDADIKQLCLGPTAGIIVGSERLGHCKLMGRRQLGGWLTWVSRLKPGRQRPQPNWGLFLDSISCTWGGAKLTGPECVPMRYVVEPIEGPEAFQLVQSGICFAVNRGGTSKRDLTQSGGKAHLWSTPTLFQSGIVSKYLSAVDVCYEEITTNNNCPGVATGALSVAYGTDEVPDQIDPSLDYHPLVTSPALAFDPPVRPDGLDDAASRVAVSFDAMKTQTEMIRQGTDEVVHCRYPIVDALVCMMESEGGFSGDAVDVDSSVWWSEKRNEERPTSHTRLRAAPLKGRVPGRISTAVASVHASIMKPVVAASEEKLQRVDPADESVAYVRRLARFGNCNAFTQDLTPAVDLPKRLAEREFKQARIGKRFVSFLAGIVAERICFTDPDLAANVVMITSKEGKPSYGVAHTRKFYGSLVPTDAEVSFACLVAGETKKQDKVVKYLGNVFKNSRKGVPGSKVTTLRSAALMVCSKCSGFWLPHVSKRISKLRRTPTREWTLGSSCSYSSAWAARYRQAYYTLSGAIACMKDVTPQLFAEPGLATGSAREVYIMNYVYQLMYLVMARMSSALRSAIDKAHAFDHKDMWKIVRGSIYQWSLRLCSKYSPRKGTLKTLREALPTVDSKIVNLLEKSLFNGIEKLSHVCRDWDEEKVLRPLTLSEVCEFEATGHTGEDLTPIDLSVQDEFLDREAIEFSMEILQHTEMVLTRSTMGQKGVLERLGFGRTERAVREVASTPDVSAEQSVGAEIGHTPEAFDFSVPNPFGLLSRDSETSTEGEEMAVQGSPTGAPAALTTPTGPVLGAEQVVEVKGELESPFTVTCEAATATNRGSKRVRGLRTRNRSAKVRTLKHIEDDGLDEV